MTQCDFSVRSAREETRHIIGGTEPDVIIGSDKDQNRGCKKKDKDHMEFLCELYEAQAARGRYFVHELTSEVNSRMRCVAKVMAMPGDESSSGGSVHVRVLQEGLWLAALVVRLQFYAAPESGGRQQQNPSGSQQSSLCAQVRNDEKDLCNLDVPEYRQ